MFAEIFIHADGEIKEKFSVEFDFISELQELLDYARSHYGSFESFCFDVMLVRSQNDCDS